MPVASAGMLRWPVACGFATMSARGIRSRSPLKFTQDFGPFVLSRSTFSSTQVTTKAMTKSEGVPARLEIIKRLFSSTRQGGAATLRLALLLGCLLAACGVTTAQQFGADSYSGMRWRLLGPFRAGRVTAVAGIPARPD